MRTSILVAAAAALNLTGTAAVTAAERYIDTGYYGVEPGYAGHGGYGFADAAVGGAYIGAPFTQFPRPSALVPPAQGYGSYGVPTVTGIRQAPAARPQIFVVNTPPTRRTRSRLLTRSQGGWVDRDAGSEVGVTTLGTR